jgi:hypothetical protein
MKMTDFDADEPVMPLPARKKRFWTTDRIIGWSGAGIAMMAAFFPWYVFVNEDKFGLEALRAMVSGDAAVPSRHMTMDNANPGIPERRSARITPDADPLVTGTVPSTEVASLDSEQELPSQPFPTAPRNFRLLKVINDQAMIEDVTGIYVVRQGDVLPDRTKVARLEKRDGTWVLLTDGGAAYTVAEK